MCKLKTERDSEGEKRSSCKKKSDGGDLRRRPCNLPRYLTGCFMSVAESEKGGRLIIQLTEVFLWWMSRGAGGREGGRGVCNKAECISPGMKLQRLGGGGAEEREGKAGEVLQILACERAQVHACSACSHMYTYVCVTWRRQFSSELLLTSVC